MITIDLGLYASGTSICTLCRQLIREGMDPNETVHFTRNQVPVFADVRPLKHWAKYHVAESSGDHFPGLVPYEVNTGSHPVKQKEFTHG